MREAMTDESRERWRAEQLHVTREVRAVDPDSRSAIEAHIARLRDELAAKPRFAPDDPRSK